MDLPGPDAISESDARWATLLLRGVAELAELLPDESASGRGDTGQRDFVYGPDAAQDDDAYEAWLALRAEERAAVREHNRRALSGISDAPSVSVVGGASVEAWNTAAHEVTGSFLAFLDDGDELEPGVLDDIALALHADPDIDVLYTDSDVLTGDGRQVRPFFKPGWAPDQLLSHMYVGRLLVVRRSLFDELDGFRPEFRGAAEHDFALRATERARRIVRLPIVGYHRRSSSETSVDDEASILVLEDALRRRGESGCVEPGLRPGTYRVRRTVRGDPLVTVIVPFHNGAEHLRRCVRSLQETAGYERWEAILVDNRSWDPNTRAVLARFESDPRIKVLSYPGRFNWAAINNYAAKHSQGAHLLFMNADVEGGSDGWMTAMLEHAQRPAVGAVGARLLYPNGQVQHAGVVMGLGGGVAWHAFCYCPEGLPGYFDQAKVIRNYSAVTGACMMVRYEVFERLGGFGEDLPVAYNDVDFCLRLHDHGYHVVYTPFAELIHDESYTRGRVPPDHYAVETMSERWGDRIAGDPYYNPNLDLHRPEGVLAGRGGAPWPAT
jgi:GT2 family glycosyltransferase